MKSLNKSEAQSYQDNSMLISQISELFFPIITSDDSKSLN